MSKHIFPILIALLTAVPATAQRNLSANEEKIASYIENYQFDEAEELIDKEITQLKRRRKSTTELEKQTERIERLRSMMNACERVTFIDSIVTGKKDFLTRIQLTPESGSLSPYNTFFNRQDSACMVYKTERGNKICFSQTAKDGKTHLFSSDLIGGEWNEPRLLDELADGGQQNYPFMLSDGVTLYYGSENEESIGGFDIYVTRYDMDERKYLTPENIGMPFNSPANDYLYAIDEMNNLGWFVTDRHQPKDSVCIYIFIPNRMRQIYNSFAYEPSQMAGLARISSISETWTDRDMVNNAKRRLAAILSGESKTQTEYDFTLVINDRLTYHFLKDFKSADARKKAETWQKNKDNLSKQQKNLASLRDRYAAGNNTQKAQMKQQILDMETQCEKMAATLKQMEKDIRKAELKLINKD